MIYEEIFKPQTFEEYVGQERAKSIIQIMIDAADEEERFYPNLLFTGPPGTGKTSLAKIVLSSIPHKFIDGATLNNVYSDQRGFLIVDEIHNTKADICDALNVLIDNSNVIIMGCTTNPGMLPAAFRSRFQIITLDPYSIDDIVQIMSNVLERKGTITAGRDKLVTIAERSRGTPRVALKYLALIIDLMVVRKLNTLDNETLEEAFELLGVDDQGLLDVDRQYLDAFPTSGQPVGIQYLQAVLGRDRETIEEEIEPYLLQLKLVDRTPRGRKLIIDEQDAAYSIVEALFAGVQ